QHAIVVGHLLEVRDDPARIRCIPMEAAADLIVYAASPHGRQGLVHNAAGPVGAGVEMEIEQQVERPRVWKLRSAAEAAVAEVECAREFFRRGLNQAAIDVTAFE